MSLVSAIQCIRLFIAARYFLLILPVLNPHITNLSKQYSQSGIAGFLICKYASLFSVDYIKW